MSDTLRLIACAAIIMGGGYLGILFSSALDIRTRQIEQLRLSVEQIGFSISFLKMPLCDAISGASKSRSGAVGEILKSASEEMKRGSISPSVAFERAVNKSRSRLCLKGDDISIIMDFAQNLGVGDIEKEMGNIRAASARLSIAQSSAESEQSRKGKLWKGMGFLCGIFAVIMLI